MSLKIRNECKDPVLFQDLLQQLTDEPRPNKTPANAYCGTMKGALLEYLWEWGAPDFSLEDWTRPDHGDLQPRTERVLKSQKNEQPEDEYEDEHEYDRPGQPGFLTALPIENRGKDILPEEIYKRSLKQTHALLVQKKLPNGIPLNSSQIATIVNYQASTYHAEMILSCDLRFNKITGDIAASTENPDHSRLSVCLCDPDRILYWGGKALLKHRKDVLDSEAVEQEGKRKRKEERRREREREFDESEKLAKKRKLNEGAPAVSGGAAASSSVAGPPPAAAPSGKDGAAAPAAKKVAAKSKAGAKAKAKSKAAAKRGAKKVEASDEAGAPGDEGAVGPPAKKPRAMKKET